MVTMLTAFFIPVGAGKPLIIGTSSCFSNAIVDCYNADNPRWVASTSIVLGKR